MSNHSLPLLENLLERKLTYISGGHAIWPHNSFQVTTIEGRGKVQRLWYAKRHGPIPTHMFLLNACGVPNCIEPACHVLSTAPHLAVAREAGAVHRTPDGPACALAGALEARCHAAR